MIILARVKNEITNFVKLLRFGKSDVQTSQQFLPAGVDSKPIPEQLAAQGITQSKGDSIVFGYEVLKDVSSPGEIRIYAVDSSGNEVFYLYLKDDGTCEFNGNIDNLIRYTQLNTALQSFITDLNAKLTAAFAAVPVTWPGVSLDISASKIDEIKTS